MGLRCQKFTVMVVGFLAPRQTQALLLIRAVLVELYLSVESTANIFQLL